MNIIIAKSRGEYNKMFHGIPDKKEGAKLYKTTEKFQISEKNVKR